MNIYSLKLPVDETTSLLDKEHNCYIMYAFRTHLLVLSQIVIVRINISKPSINKQKQ